MSARVIDIETNGLTPDKIWCVADEEKLYRDPESFLASLDGEAQYAAHNGIGFDYPVLHELWGFDMPHDKLIDTMVLSRLANPSRDGGHSLDNWGTVLGFPKGDHSDWSRYTPEMGEYCKRDVLLNRRVLDRVTKELEGFDQRSIDLEHQVAWIIQEQMDNGWLLNQQAAWELLGELQEKKIELAEVVRETFKPIATPVREITPKVKKDGTFSVVGLKYLGDDCLSIVGGPHTRIDWQEFNLGSREQAAERFIKLGWKPTQFTETGRPTMSETVLMNITGFPEAQLIADFMTVQKRIAMVQSWLEHVEEDGRVHGKVNSNGAVTGRMTHYEPNMAQVTAGSKIYGTEMRSCWIAPEGYSIVGMDADGLELRMLAHYMNDDHYIQELLDGDIHTANQHAAGLATRDDAKTFIYAFLYGAGDAKIGAIVGGSKADGRRLKAEFLRNTPALKHLRERVALAAKRGWLRGLDGRKIMVRSAHAALNTLLQGAGAVVMKQALVNLNRTAKAQKFDFKFVGNIHDEIQTEVRNNQADSFGKLATYAVAKAGRDFNLRVPLKGTYKIGANWSQTH